MIHKKRKLPREILQEEALKRRLPPDHPAQEQLTESLFERWRVHQGNELINHFLHFLPEEGFELFHDLRLSSEYGEFEITTLVVTDRFIAFIEPIMAGVSLTYNGRMQQFITSEMNRTIRIPHPIKMNTIDQMKLESWIEMNGLKSVPIRCLVGISTPETRFTVEEEENFNSPVYYADHIPSQLLSLYTSLPQVLNHEDVFTFCTSLLHQHIPITQDILPAYHVDKSEILTGVQCPHCSFLPMSRGNRIWICNTCLNQSKYAHIQALHEYQLLLGDTMTNKQCREFLGITSKNISYHLLKSLNLPTNGVKRSVTYSLLPLS